MKVQVTILLIYSCKRIVPIVYALKNTLRKVCDIRCTVWKINIACLKKLMQWPICEYDKPLVYNKTIYTTMMLDAMTQPEPPIPPTTGQLLREFPNAAMELMQLASGKWKKVLADVPAGDGHAVMTIPGFAGGDGSMAFLRRFLSGVGYQAMPWGLGTNMPKDKTTHIDEILAFCEQQELLIADKVERIAEEKRSKVSLIGWSLGGVYANSLAQTRPDIIRQVITLGSPVGDPRGTSTWDILKRLNKSEVPDDMQDVSGWLARRQSQGERKVRTSVLYSLKDGAVSKESAVIENHHLVENIEVKSSHVGFAHNPLVYWIIADRLSQHPVDWANFDINKQPAFIQKKLLK